MLDLAVKQKYVIPRGPGPQCGSQRGWLRS